MAGEDRGEAGAARQRLRQRVAVVVEGFDHLGRRSEELAELDLAPAKDLADARARRGQGPQVVVVAGQPAAALHEVVQVLGLDVGQQRVGLVQQLVEAAGHAGPCDGHDLAVRVAGLGARRGRLQVDVGLAQRRLLAHDGRQLVGHRALGPDFELQLERAGNEPGRPHPSDRHTEVGHLRAGQRAARRRQLHAHDLGLVEAHVGEPEHGPRGGDQADDGDDRDVGQLLGREPHRGLPPTSTFWPGTPSTTS